MPPEAVLSGRRTEFDAALLIRPVAGRARLSGSLLLHPSEGAIRAAQTLELVITLIGDEWAPELARQATAEDRSVARALLDGIRPSFVTAASWASVVQPALGAQHVART